MTDEGVEINPRVWHIETITEYQITVHNLTFNPKTME